MERLLLSGIEGSDSRSRSYLNGERTLTFCALVLEPKNGKAIKSLGVDSVLCKRKLKGSANLAFLDQWPFPYNRPWILCGPQQSESDSEFTWTGKFEDSAFATLVELTQRDYSWLAVSYFTTFQSNYLLLLCRDSDLLEELTHHCQQNELRLIEIYRDSQTLRNACFTHDEQEGEFCLELTDELPLLVCRFDKAEDYSDWESDSSRAWFEPYLHQCEELAEWQGQYRGENYALYRPLDREAYRKLWSKSGTDQAIVAAAISPSAKPESLPGIDGRVESLRSVTDWAYTLVYGGGSDEHHAHFWSKDEAKSEKVWQKVLESEETGMRALSRF